MIVNTQLQGGEQQGVVETLVNWGGPEPGSASLSSRNVGLVARELPEILNSFDL